MLLERSSNALRSNYEVRRERLSVRPSNSLSNAELECKVSENVVGTQRGWSLRRC